MIVAVMAALLGVFMPEPGTPSFPICFMGHYGQPGGCRNR